MSQKRSFICRGPNVWGRGETPRAAQQIAKRQLGSTFKPEPGLAVFVIHSVPPGTFVNEMGGLTYTKPGEGADKLYAEPEMIGYYDINGRVPTQLNR